MGVKKEKPQGYVCFSGDIGYRGDTVARAYADCEGDCSADLDDCIFYELGRQVKVALQPIDEPVIVG